MLAFEMDSDTALWTALPVWSVSMWAVMLVVALRHRADSGRGPKATNPRPGRSDRSRVG